MLNLHRGRLQSILLLLCDGLPYRPPGVSMVTTSPASSARLTFGPSSSSSRRFRPTVKKASRLA